MLALACSHDGSVLCCEAGSGAQVWRQQLPARADAGMCVAWAVVPSAGNRGHCHAASAGAAGAAGEGVGVACDTNGFNGKGSGSGTRSGSGSSGAESGGGFDHRRPTLAVEEQAAKRRRIAAQEADTHSSHLAVTDLLRQGGQLRQPSPTPAATTAPSAAASNFSNSAAVTAPSALTINSQALPERASSATSLQARIVIDTLGTAAGSTATTSTACPAVPTFAPGDIPITASAPAAAGTASALAHAPPSASPCVCIAGGDDRLYFLSLADGALLGCSEPLGGAIRAAPATDEWEGCGLVWTSTHGGGLVAVAASTGAVVAR